MKRVIIRYFFIGDERCRDVIGRVMALSEEVVFSTISPILQEYSDRHRNITQVLNRHFAHIHGLLAAMEPDAGKIEPYPKLVIGSYFTNEYLIESAAFFNPSVVEDPDQTELEDGKKRVIISFKAVGEGHISSIVFRRAILGRLPTFRANVSSVSGILTSPNYWGEVTV